MTKKIAIILLGVFIFSCKSTQKAANIKTGDGLFQLFVEDENRNTFYSDKKGVFGANGMVASADVMASEVGTEILKKGGNAADASVATFFALAVTYPFAGNLGGGGFAVIRESNGTNHALDFREKAPLNAHRDMYLDEKGDVIKGKSTSGHLASGVPGSVAGMVELHQKLGKMSWEKLLQPAIDLAENGVILTEGRANGMNRSKKRFQLMNGDDTPYFIHPTKDEWEAGDLFVVQVFLPVK